jgi:hypothetical protein
MGGLLADYAFGGTGAAGAGVFGVSMLMCLLALAR